MVNAPSPSPVLLPKWPPSLSVYGQLGVRGVWGPITDCEKVLTPQFGVFCQPQHLHGDYWMLKLSCYCGLLLNSLTDTVEPACKVHGCKVNFCFKHGEGHMRTEYECVSVHTK